jgi:hypothetical protein
MKTKLLLIGTVLLALSACNEAQAQSAGKFVNSVANEINKRNFGQGMMCGDLEVLVSVDPGVVKVKAVSQAKQTRDLVREVQRATDKFFNNETETGFDFPVSYTYGECGGNGQRYDRLRNWNGDIFDASN